MSGGFDEPVLHQEVDFGHRQLRSIIFDLLSTGEHVSLSLGLL